VTVAKFILMLLEEIAWKHERLRRFQEGLCCEVSLEIAAVTATFFLNCIGGKHFVPANNRALSRKLLIFVA